MGKDWRGYTYQTGKLSYGLAENKHQSFLQEHQKAFINDLL